MKYIPDKLTVEDIEFISTNQDGNYYIGYRVTAPRSINAKAERKANELLIYGFHKKYLRKVLEALVNEK